MVKLKRLKILKYRNVRPGTELHFDDGVNLILGQNASGKTTLLALISAVCRGVFPVDEEFDLEATVSVGGTLVHMHRSRRRALPDETGQWIDDFKTDPPLDANPPMPSGWFLNARDWQTRKRPANLILETGDAFRFDESLAAFATATGQRVGLTGPAAPNLAHCEKEEFGPTASLTWRYIPKSIVDLLARGRASDPVFQRPLTSADLTLCRELADVSGAQDVAIRPNFQERRIQDDDIQFKIEGFTFELTRPDGTIIHHDRLSYGQKRLLAFFYYLACNPAVVIADELVNGLHHRWIETCMNAIGDRQAFLTSQNPLLFDYVEFDSVEQVRSRFITCRLEQVDGREQMVWENMSQRDAETFFTAYQAEIEHVGEILITRGLW